MRALIGSTVSDPAAVCDALDAYLRQLADGRCIACYSALPGEVDLSSLPRLHPRHLWVYPRVEGAELGFRRVRDPITELMPGSFGIPEPAASLESIPIGLIDLFLCPGLAFDWQGGRLGRGRGFYDRTLARSRRDATKAGICFPFQRVETTFVDPHDIPMDLVIDGTQSNPGT